MKPMLIAALSAAFLATPTAARANDYPTEAVADYVLGCMAANGQTAMALRQCSCSIDVVASLLTYEDYSKAETVLRMRQVAGERTALFRIPFTQLIVDKLRRAQAEAEIRCFR